MALMISSLVDLPVSAGEPLLVVAVGEVLLVVTVAELVMGESWLFIFVAHIWVLLVPGFLCVPCFSRFLLFPVRIHPAQIGGKVFGFPIHDVGDYPPSVFLCGKSSS